MIKFESGKTVNTTSVSEKTELLAGYRRSVATIETTGLTYAEAVELFADGAVWSIEENGETFTEWNSYTKAGPITDNRDGTLTIKMGAADTAEQTAQREAQAARELTATIAGRSVESREDAAELRSQLEAVYQAAPMSADERIQNANLAKRWAAGRHEVDEICTVDGGAQPWKCIQAHDNSSNPDIVPGNPSWGTFWAPYHGTTQETALPWVAPTGAHDMYKTGEYMTYTDRKVYRCKSDTNFSPEDYAQAWEVVLK